MSFMESPRFPTDINYSVVGGPMYKTHIVVKNSGFENANSVWPEGRHEYDVVYAVKDQATIESLLDFYHAMKGRFHQFRFKDFSDFKSVPIDSSISALDQPMQGDVDGVNATYQLLKQYNQGTFTTIRSIRKPVAGTVIVAISGVQIVPTQFSVDTTTGALTFNTGDSDVITGATNANPCVLTANNTLSTATSIHISGIVGMTQLNGNRYNILSRTSTTITIDVDSTSFGTYISGGQFNSLPETGENVTAGYEFDVPVRFVDDKLPISIDSPNTRTVQSLPLIEVRV